MNSKVHCWISENDELIYFPLYDIHKRLIGYQKYNWKEPKIRCNYGKYYTYISQHWRPDKRTPPLALWGMEFITQAKIEGAKCLFITEGVWDAVRIIEVGFMGAAILTATPDPTFLRWFRMLTHDIATVAICDNDKSGTGLKLARATDYYVTVPGLGSDMNSLDRTTAREFLGNIYGRFTR